MYNKHFDIIFSFHQCSISNERMVVMTTESILLLQTGLNIRTIAHKKIKNKSRFIAKYKYNGFDLS